jgi:hypothetical protein
MASVSSTAAAFLPEVRGTAGFGLRVVNDLNCNCNQLKEQLITVRSEKSADNTASN